MTIHANVWLLLLMKFRLTIMAETLSNSTITYGIDRDSVNRKPECYQNLATWKYCASNDYLKLNDIHLTSILPLAEIEFKVFDVILNASDQTSPDTLFGALLAGKLKCL